MTTSMTANSTKLRSIPVATPYVTLPKEYMICIHTQIYACLWDKFVKKIHSYERYQKRSYSSILHISS